MERQYKASSSYSFLDGGYPFVNQEKNLWISLNDSNEISINSRNDDSKFELKGTYSVNNTLLTCNFNKCILENEKEIAVDVYLVLRYYSNDWKFIVDDWQYKANTEIPTCYDAYFSTDFVNVGDEYHGATV